MQTADLHFHTTCSDGKHSVEWIAALLRQRKQEGLGLAVLTDHDGVDGFSYFSEEIKELWRPIRACELSCIVSREGRDQELHLLIYGIEEADAYLNPIFEKFRSARESRFLEICRRLNAAGFAVDAEKLVREHPGRLGRPHVADALVAAGHAKTRQDAFDRFLYKGSPYNVPKWKLGIDEVLKYTKSKSYPTALAHPGIYGLKEGHLSLLKDMGLTGVEVFHPRHTPAQTQSYLSLAKKLSLEVSGGSDFHDAASDIVGNEPSLGRTVYPLELAEKFLRDIL